MKKSLLHAYVGLVVVVVLWGANFAVVKAALAELHPLAFNGARFLLAGVMLYALLRRRGQVRLPPREDMGAVLFLGFIGHSVYQLTFIYGLDMTLAGNAAILLASTPIWTLVITAVLGKEQTGPILWMAALLGAVGIVFVLTGGEKALDLGTEQLRGDLLIASGAFCWAIYTVAGKGLLVRHGSLQVTAWALWFGATPLVLIGIPPAIQTDWTALPAEVWWGILYAGIGAVGIAYTLWYGAVDTLGSPRTALWSNVVPAVGILTAWLYLGEVPGPGQLVGLALIIGSVLLTRRPSSNKAPTVVAAAK